IRTRRSYRETPSCSRQNFGFRGSFRSSPTAGKHRCVIDWSRDLWESWQVLLRSCEGELSANANPEADCFCVVALCSTSPAGEADLVQEASCVIPVSSV